jgi:predicted outer membrane repeat protein
MSKYLKLLIVFVFALILPLTEAKAATINVGTFDDENFNENSNCSLRAAVLSANEDKSIGGCTAGSGDDTIILLQGTYTLTRSCDIQQSPGNLISKSSDSITDCDDLDIYENLTVLGAGKELTVITVESDLLNTVTQAPDFNFRVFDVHTEHFDSAALNANVQAACPNRCTQGTTLSLKNLEIKGAADFNGGAVRVGSDEFCEYSKLATDNVLFLKNSSSYNGGAVYVVGQYSGTATEYDSNATQANGGGLYINGDTRCSLTNSIVNSKFVDNKSYHGEGGGLFSDTDTSVDIAGSTIISNHAALAGGGIAGNIGTITINNSEISQNGLESNEEGALTPIFGGGIFVGEFSDLIPVDTAGFTTAGSDYEGQSGKMTLLIQNSTILNNQAQQGGGGIGTFDNYFRIIIGPLGSSFDTAGKNCDLGIINVDANVRDSYIKDNFLKFSKNFLPTSSEVVSIPALIALKTGGGILHSAFGKFTVETSTIDSNEASLGAGIANFYELNVTKTTVLNNTALIPQTLQFGGLAGAEEQDAKQYLYATNRSGGGGIFNGGSADIINTTVSGNKTDGSGAGIFNFTELSYVFLYQDLLNQNPQQMGEIGQPSEPLAPVTAPGTRLNNDTIAHNEIAELVLPDNINSENSITAAYVNNGGGIASFKGNITLSNTVVATNKDDFAIVNLNEFAIGAVKGMVEFEPTPNGTPEADPTATPTATITPVNPSAFLGDFAPDCFILAGTKCGDFNQETCALIETSITTAQHNLIGNNLGCTPFQPSANNNFDLVGTADAIINPLIGDLANNGGKTLTHLPNKGSPLIDNGSDAAVLSAQLSTAVAGKACQLDDQRTVVRPKDGNNDKIAVCDIGAVEVVVDCDSVPGGTKIVDACGVCGGDGTSCLAKPEVPLSCTETNIVNSLIVLDGSAHDLANLTNALIRITSHKGGKSQKANKKLHEQANALLNLAWTNTWNIPNKIQSNCTGGLKLKCATVSNDGLKEQYSSTVNQLFELNQGLLTQIKKLKTKLKAKALARFQTLNDKALATALTTLGKVPASTVSCL